MESSWVLTLISLIPKPLSSEAFLQKNIPTYPVSVFSEMPMESRKKRIKDIPSLANQPWETFNMEQPQGSLHPWASIPAGEEQSLLTFSKTPQSPLPEESSNTGDIRKQQKTPNSKQHRQ